MVGGQAVNYWAERYVGREPELRKLLPFTSEDIDFHGNRDDVARIAQQLDLTPVYPHRVEMTALAGAIPFRIGGVDSNIEVVRLVPWISAGTIESLAIQSEWSGKVIRVLKPVSLVASKLVMSLTLQQDGRRDVEHLEILVYCVRGFLRELLELVESGSIPARGWLGAANKIVKLTTSAKEGRLSIDSQFVGETFFR